LVDEGRKLLAVRTRLPIIAVSRDNLGGVV